MVEILRKIEEIDGKLSLVSINDQRLLEFTSAVQEKDLKISEISLSHYQWNKEKLLDLVFAFNSVNFCFWAEKDQAKWTATFNDEKLDGSTALFRAFEEGLRKNPDFTNGGYFAQLDASTLAVILKGNVEIPLFKERLGILNEVGQTLKDKYNGSFSNLFQACGNDSTKLTTLVVSQFPSFVDEETYKGMLVPFYKRAQLNSKMISDTQVSFEEKPLENLDKLTAFADYKIPQLLRKFGILEYDSDLASKIDELIVIANGSAEEVEIRIATILAVEKMRKELIGKFNWVTSSHIDSMLWNKSQNKELKVKPYHRTYTTAY